MVSYKNLPEPNPIMKHNGLPTLKVGASTNAPLVNSMD